MATISRLAPLLLLLASCSSTKSQWAVDHVHASSPEFASSKLTFRSKDRSGGVDLELLKIGGAEYLYLTVHAQEVPAFNENPKSARVLISTQGESAEVIAYRHEGGQRLLLPDASHALILEALKAGKNVTISLEGYRTLINAASFNDKYRSWNSPPFMKNPFHLPF